MQTFFFFKMIFPLTLFVQYSNHVVSSQRRSNHYRVLTGCREHVWEYRDFMWLSGPRAAVTGLSSSPLCSMEKFLKQSHKSRRMLNNSYVLGGFLFVNTFKHTFIPLETFLYHDIYEITVSHDNGFKSYIFIKSYILISSPSFISRRGITF